MGFGFPFAGYCFISRNTSHTRYYMLCLIYIGYSVSVEICRIVIIHLGLKLFFTVNERLIIFSLGWGLIFFPTCVGYYGIVEKLNSLHAWGIGVISNYFLLY